MQSVTNTTLRAEAISPQVTDGVLCSISPLNEPALISAKAVSLTANGGMQAPLAKRVPISRHTRLVRVSNNELTWDGDGSDGLRAKIERVRLLLSI